MKKPTVTIGICAYNEEDNIERVLESVFAQNVRSFVIHQMRVLSDGSSDQTVKRAQSVPRPNNIPLTIAASSKRLGKTARMNTLLRECTSDIFVLIDADVELQHKDCLEELIKPLMKDKNVGLVGGYCKYRAPKTLLQRSIASSVRAYDNLAHNYKRGRTHLTCSGGFLALPGTFAKTIQIPNEVYSTDTYLYLLCLQNKKKYMFALRATALYDLPSTYREHFNRLSRYTSTTEELTPFFGDMAVDVLRVEPSLLMKYKIQEILRNPLGALSIALLNKYISLSIKYKPVSLDSKH